MSNKSTLLKTLGVLLAMSTFLFADDGGTNYAKEGFYIGTELGGTVIPNVDIGDGEQVNFNPGIRFDLPIGYRVNEWFSLEFAPGGIWNSLNSVETDSASIPSVSVGGNLWQVPLMVNFILTIPTDSKWEPFFGGGVGGIFSSLTVDEILGFSIPARSGTSWALGYSAIAGLNYHLSRDISFGFNYKFTGTGSQTWGGDFQDVLPTTNIYTHSASLSATFRF